MPMSAAPEARLTPVTYAKAVLLSGVLYVGAAMALAYLVPARNTSTGNVLSLVALAVGVWAGCRALGIRRLRTVLLVGAGVFAALSVILVGAMAIT